MWLVAMLWLSMSILESEGSENTISGSWHSVSCDVTSPLTCLWWEEDGWCWWWRWTMLEWCHSHSQLLQHNWTVIILLSFITIVTRLDDDTICCCGRAKLFCESGLSVSLILLIHWQGSIINLIFCTQICMNVVCWVYSAIKFSEILFKLVNIFYFSTLLVIWWWW